MSNLTIVVAHDNNLGIGKNGQIPWHCPQDLHYFKHLTSKTTDPKKQNMVLMGRKTWESLPDKFRPLPNRINGVLTRNKAYSLPEGTHLFSSLEMAIQATDNSPLCDNVETVFLIGGGQLYQEGLQKATLLYVTHIHTAFDCDTFFPPYTHDFSKIAESEPKSDHDIVFNFATYHKH